MARLLGEDKAQLSVMHNSTFVPASAAAFHFEGRIDKRKPAEAILIWQGSQVDVDFEGDSLSIRFGPAKGASFFNLTIDGATLIVEVKEGAASLSFNYPKPLGSGWHHLTLFKRSEADAGYVAFQGIEIEPSAGVRSSKLPTQKLKMQFFGDSITVGACNEDGAEDQWENRRTHNNALSYAALTAQAFQADYRNIAVSGMGIVTGYVPKRAGQIWDRLYPEIDAPKAEETDWSPDVVFVNYGENDDSFTKNAGVPFPAEFTDGYVALVEKMAKAYPKAEIVLLRGGMFGGAKSEPLRMAWIEATTQLEAHNVQVHHFVFEHWSGTHPRVTDDKILAEELTNWLRKQPFLKRFL